MILKIGLPFGGDPIFFYMIVLFLFHIVRVEVGLSDNVKNTRLSFLVCVGTFEDKLYLSNMKKIFFVMAIICLAVLTSCGKDEEVGGQIGDVTLLYGTWDPVHSKGYEGAGSESYEEWDEDLDVTSPDCWVDRLVVSEDVFSFCYYSNGSWVTGDSFWNWRIDNGYLYLDDAEVEELTSFKIVSLTANELVIEDSDTGYYEQVTYRKVSE